MHILELLLRSTSKVIACSSLRDCFRFTSNWHRSFLRPIWRRFEAILAAHFRVSCHRWHRLRVRTMRCLTRNDGMWCFPSASHNIGRRPPAAGIRGFSSRSAFRYGNRLPRREKPVLRSKADGNRDIENKELSFNSAGAQARKTAQTFVTCVASKPT